LIENKIQLGFNYVNKFDFLKICPQAHTEVFRSDTIKNSFSATDLILFNPERVLGQLNIQLKTFILLDS